MSPAPAKLSLIPLILCIILSPLLFFGQGLAEHEPWQQALWNFGHIPFFGLLVFSLRTYVLRNLRHFFLGLVVLVFLSLVIEYLQLCAGRFFEWQDIARNLSAYLLISLAAPHRFRLAAMVSLTLLLYWVWLPIETLHTQIAQQSRFPLLFDFENSQQRRWLNPDLEIIIDPENRSNLALRVPFYQQPYDGLTLSVFPRDWSRFDQLSFRLFWPSTTSSQLFLRIHDQSHDNAFQDRFNTTLTIVPGWQTVEIPLLQVAQSIKHRNFQMHKIAGLILFGQPNAGDPSFFLVDDWRLNP